MKYSWGVEVKEFEYYLKFNCSKIEKKIQWTISIGNKYNIEKERIFTINNDNLNLILHKVISNKNTLKSKQNENFEEKNDNCKENRVIFQKEISSKKYFKNTHPDDNLLESNYNTLEKTINSVENIYFNCNNTENLLRKDKNHSDSKKFIVDN